MRKSFQVFSFRRRRSVAEARANGFFWGWVCIVSAVATGSWASVRAQVPAGVAYICDSTDDRVIALRDVDRSGAVDPGRDAVVVFYDDSSPGPDLSTPSHVWVDDDGTLYLLDGGTLDMILSLKDVTGDGDANEPGEVQIFYDGAIGAVALRTPNTLIRGPDDAFYVVDDSSVAPQIVRLQDLDRNGDALGSGDATIVYDLSALSVAGPQDMESLAFDRQGRAYVGDSASGAVFRMSDDNGDGDFLDEQEVRLFFQSTPAFPLTDVDCLVFADGDVYVCDEDTGVVLRLSDRNGDGSIEPALDEVSTFLDGTLTGDTNDLLRLPTGTFLVLDGAADTVFAVTDQDGDGKASGVDEVLRWLVDDGSTLATPSGIAFFADSGNEQFLFVRGNAVADEKLDVSDPIFILQYLFGDGDYGGCLDVLDADDNAWLNITDPVYILNFLFASGNAPPPPFPEIGSDPTEDAWNCAPTA